MSIWAISCFRSGEELAGGIRKTARGGGRGG